MWCCFFYSDLGEVSQLHSTQMTCLSLNLKEEGQGQLQGHDWVGLEIWDNLTGEKNWTNGLWHLYPHVQAMSTCNVSIVPGLSSRIPCLPLGLAEGSVIFSAVRVGSGWWKSCRRWALREPGEEPKLKCQQHLCKNDSLTSIWLRK